MEYYKPSDGPYYVCVKCNRIDYPIEPNLGNTHLIDLEYDKEVDKIVDRGRD